MNEIFINSQKQMWIMYVCVSLIYRCSSLPFIQRQIQQINFTN